MHFNTFLIIYNIYKGILVTIPTKNTEQIGNKYNIEIDYTWE